MLGREGELAAVLAAADLARAGSGRLVEITGDAGSGKSTLVANVVDRLRGDGFAVWRHTATLPEQALSWAGLATMLTGVDRTAIDTLPVGLQAHLSSITEPDPAIQVEAHGVAIAMRELLAPATAERPLAIVLDDENWLDPATAGVITFTARSLPDHPLLLVLARRSEERSSVDVSALPRDRRTGVTLAGLCADEIAEILRPLVGRSVDRVTVRSVHERSGGNPMLATEIGRQLAAGEPLERALLPRSIAESLRPRLDALPPDCVRALRYAALLAVASVDVVSEAIDGDAVTAIAPAETAGLAELHAAAGTTVVRFTHPTVAAAALATLPTAELRAANARLAAIVDDPESRGVHLAASAPAPGDEPAAILEAAADLAQRRGACDAANRLYRASVDTTPPGREDDRQRRLMALAHVQSIGLMRDENLATLREIDAAPGTVEFDRVVTMRVAALATCVSLDAARRDAWASIDAVTTARGRLFLWSQIALLERSDDLRRGLDAAERALAEARESTSEAVETATLSVAVSRVLLGEPVDIDEMIEPAHVWDERMHLGNAMEELVQLLWFAGDPRGVEWARRMLATATANGDVVTEVNARSYLAEMLVVRGDWAEAERLFRGTLHGDADAAERGGLAFLEASTGRVNQARHTLAALEPAEQLRGRLHTVHVTARRAMAAFALGDDALEQLIVTHEIAGALRLRAPRAIPYRRDLVEALVAAGRGDEAHAVATEMDEIAERSGLDSARADADAALAVVAAASGDDETAASRAVTAAKLHDRDGDRYELARTLLAAGRAARRANRRTDARRHLEAADALFTGMGATPWIDRCRTELARIGGRPKRTSTLTPTERQIAERAAAGETNVEIAAAMFISLRTVESNLSRCYRKLSIRSRVELAASLARLDA